MTTEHVSPDFYEAPEVPPGVEVRRRPGGRRGHRSPRSSRASPPRSSGRSSSASSRSRSARTSTTSRPSVTITATVVQDLCLIGARASCSRGCTGASRRADFGLRPTRLWPAIGWAVLGWVAFLAFTAIFVAIIGGSPNDDKLPKELGVDDSTAALLAVAFLVSVVAPVAEEFFFRGYFFAALRNWRGVWPAAIRTGIVFGAIHGSSADPAFLLPLAFFGFVLCLIYARTGSLYPCIALHCANNSVAFGVLAALDVADRGPVRRLARGDRARRARRAPDVDPRPPAPAPAAASVTAAACSRIARARYADVWWLTAAYAGTFARAMMRRSITLTPSPAHSCRRCPPPRPPSPRPLRPRRSSASRPSRSPSAAAGVRAHADRQWRVRVVAQAAGRGPDRGRALLPPRAAASGRAAPARAVADRAVGLRVVHLHVEDARGGSSSARPTSRRRSSGR